MYLFLFLALLITLGLVLFAVQNATLIAISFLSFRFEGSLAFILVFVFALGILSGMLMTIPSFWRKSTVVREQKKKLKQLEERLKVHAVSEPQQKERTDTQ